MATYPGCRLIELRKKLDQQQAEQEAFVRMKERERKAARYFAVRKHRMPLMIAATRKKLAMLENEARQYGLNPEAL